MRRTCDRPLVLLVVAALSAAGCSAPSVAADPTTGAVGSTLGAAGAQFTLDEIIPDATQQLVTAVLTIHNTSAATATFSILPVISLLSDAAGHTYTPNENTGAFVGQCQGVGLFAPLDPGQSVQGCEYFSVPLGSVPAQLELLVHPTLRWSIANAPPPGTAVPSTSGGSQSGTGTGTGPGTGTGTGPGTGTGTGPGTGTGKVHSKVHSKVPGIVPVIVPGVGPAKKNPVVHHPKLHHPRGHHPKKTKKTA